MRIRTLKPEWLADEKLGALSDSERVLTIGLILMADDHGRGKANPALVRSTVWPYGDPPESLQKITERLRRLSGIGFIQLYTVDDQHYYEIANWLKHQKISHPGKPIEPPPPEHSGDPPETLRSFPEILRPDLNQDLNQDQECARETLQNFSEEEPPPSKLASWKDAPFIWQRVIACWVEKSGYPIDAQANRQDAEAIAMQCQTVDVFDPYEPLGHAFDNWLADDWVRKTRPGLSNLRKNFHKYISDPLPEPGRASVYDRDTKVFEQKAREDLAKYNQEIPEERELAMQSAKKLVEEIKKKAKLGP